MDALAAEIKLQVKNGTLWAYVMLLENCHNYMSWKNTPWMENGASSVEKRQFF